VKAVSVEDEKTRRRGHSIDTDYRAVLHIDHLVLTEAQAKFEAGVQDRNKIRLKSFLGVLNILLGLLETTWDMVIVITNPFQVGARDEALQTCRVLIVFTSYC